MPTPIRSMDEMEEAQANPHLIFNEAIRTLESQLVSFRLPASDLTTALTAGTNRAYFRAPRPFLLTGVRASLLTAAAVGIVTVDIMKNGVTMLTTLLTIDATETTSATAAVPAVINAATDDVADDDLITIDITVPGDTAAGLIVTLLGTLA